MRIVTARISFLIISLVILLSNNSESGSFAFHPSRHSSLIHPTCRPQIRRRGKCHTQAWSKCTSQQYNNRHMYMGSSFSLHSINHRGIDNITENNDSGDDVPSMKTLLQLARRLREKLYKNATPSFLADPNQLAYPSTYNMAIETNNYKQFTFIAKNNRSKSKDNSESNNCKSTKRGFCNWLLPQTVMIGQYPGQTPETYGPSMKECRRHIQTMVRDANISLFCCLQTEVPPQDDRDAWTFHGNSGEGGEDGEIYLEPWAARREFPRPFTRYGPLARSLAEDPSALTFLHCPIEDLSVPSCRDEVVSILWRLLCHLDGDFDGVGGNDAVGVVAGDGCQDPTLAKRAIYIHCWGGRGRAGLVGSCLISLLFPELTSSQVLEYTQCGYDTREGADRMPVGLRKSPQTEEQRRFVREFVDVVRKEVELVK
mmetsp:Transcript_21135/g.43134  ORF Transcript_21135/g.43134 Transcript_21135/m.43134 type:complete len:427 (+) Transcript_21135:8-1288(+)